MPTAASQTQTASWLVENGPRELELLFRAIVYHPSIPILIADNDRNYHDASAGASKMLRLARHRIIGQKIDDFVDPGFKPAMSEMWRDFLGQGEQEGALRLLGPDGNIWEVPYSAKGNVLPVRHVLVLRDKTNAAKTEGAAEAGEEPIPPWVQDYALFLLDANGRIADWYAGAGADLRLRCRGGARSTRLLPLSAREDVKRRDAAGAEPDRY